MSEILLFRTKPKNMKAEEFSKMTKMLGFEEKVVETDEALAVRGSSRTLAYGNPCAKYAGVLFYTDQSQSLGEISEKVTDAKQAKRWADDFLKQFQLPKGTRDDRIDFKFDTSSFMTQAVTFDGKERKKVNVKSDVVSKMTLNGIAVTGGRAKVRMVFKDKEMPSLMHVGLWENIEVYESRELVSEHEVVKTVNEKLAKRRNCKSANRIVDVKLAYFAKEFNGGPDVLAPYYFIEMEFEDKNGSELGIEEGPKQIFWLPAYR
jgi:hypothetical protein